MTPEKLQTIIATTRARILKLQPATEAKKYEFSTPPHIHSGMRHLIWMLDRLAEPSDDSSKTQRWLGFVQGALWVFGLFSIDEMRMLNRDDS